MRNYFTFGQFDSRDFGVYISGEGTYNAPARVYDVISVPGRNGDLLIDRGKFENIFVKYPAFIAGDNFRSNLAAFRSAMLSGSGYARLTDTYHPDEFRLAYYGDPIEMTARKQNNGAEFDIVFNCKPQRFLLSGETPVIFSADGSITNPTLFDSKPSIKVSPANYIPYPYYESTTTTRGITYTDNGDGTITANGTANGYSYFDVLDDTQEVRLQAGTYIARGCPTGGKINIMQWNGSANIIIATMTGTEEITFEITQEDANMPVTVEIGVKSGTTLNNAVFAPYIGATGGTKQLSIGDTVITLGAISPYVIIDSEIEDCYRGTNNLNSQVSFSNGKFPVLKPGANGISVSGVTAEITPRWWRI